MMADQRHSAPGSALPSTASRARAIHAAARRSSASRAAGAVVGSSETS